MQPSDYRRHVVNQIAIESSARGDGRFIEGSAVITPERRPPTTLEVMTEFARIMGRTIGSEPGVEHRGTTGD